ncbi:hypothetical protein C8Q77DRAFT_1030866, partial [Trametes polyzona]
RSSPIAVPRRKTAQLSPCSPPMDQNSPELIFDFSMSPDAPIRDSAMFLQNQGVTARLFPLQQNAYFPLSALSEPHVQPSHPYADEPFLYSVPKAPFRDAQNTYSDSNANNPINVKPQASCAVQLTPNTVSLDRPPPSSVLPHPSATLLPKHDDNEHDHSLISAFRTPMVSTSYAPSTTACEDYGSFSPSRFYHSPSPSPPRARSPMHRRHAGGRPHHLLPTKSKALQRTVAAAPVISLNCAQAERPTLNSCRHFPYPGRTGPRTRRSSITNEGHGVGKSEERCRRMSTVVGRGAVRVVTRSASGLSLVSNDDLERSLEKDDIQSNVCSRGRSLSRRRREEAPSATEQLFDEETEPERGRGRGRVPLRGHAALT